MEKNASIRVCSEDSKQTEKLGKVIASIISKFPKIGLVGNLGGGKTTFTKGFSLGLGIKERVLSSTFLIVREYNLKKGNFNKFYHADLYRLGESALLTETGLSEALQEEKSIVLVEWADKVSLKNFDLIIEFKFKDENTREINFKSSEKNIALIKKEIKNDFRIKEWWLRVWNKYFSK